MKDTVYSSALVLLLAVTVYNLVVLEKLKRQSYEHTVRMGLLSEEGPEIWELVRYHSIDLKIQRERTNDLYIMVNRHTKLVAHPPPPEPEDTSLDEYIRPPRLNVDDFTQYVALKIPAMDMWSVFIREIPHHIVEPLPEDGHWW